MNPIRSFLVNLIWERPARKLSLGDHARVLHDSGAELQARLAETPDSDRNRQVLNHIVGIERWSQSRLRVALGEPYQRDEYDDYRPKRDATWDELRAQFATTRAQTVVLAGELQQGGVDSDTTVPHNSYGPLTVRGWLRYINTHCVLESKRIKA